YTQDNHPQKYKIDFKISDGSFLLNGDAEKLYEAVTHLLDNAIKYSCIENKCGIIKMELGRKGDEAVLSVSDNGIGISKSDQKYIAEKFFQAKRFDATTPVEQQGSGLALYITRRTVEMHHGRIWLDSASGKGTTFYISLPLSK
ncbi:MAG: ATP-binding protein, partial [Candidatus Berkelbacteria bacterium]|nr:ATP-binding protein [Candidatus Berkelbacteria bacterium]